MMACVPREETGRAAGTLGQKDYKVCARTRIIGTHVRYFTTFTTHKGGSCYGPRDLETFILQLSRKLEAKKEIFYLPYS